MISVKWSKDEQRLFKRLSTPSKVQDFLNRIPASFKKMDDEVCMSPRRTLAFGKTHCCVEGAMLGAAILEFHQYKPLLMDLRSDKSDLDHVIAVFKIGKYFGALSKTNHAVLRFREPVYLSIRELAMSFFHEYFLDDGRKTMLDYSLPINLNRFNNLNWRTTDEELYDIPYELDHARHYPVVPKPYRKHLRRADKIEIEAGKLLDWKPPRRAR